MGLLDVFDRIVFAPRREAFGRSVVILILIAVLVLASRGVLPAMPEIPPLPPLG